MADDADVGAGRPRGAVLRERLEVAPVPGVAHDGRERVAVAADHAQRARELALEDQQALVLDAFVGAHLIERALLLVALFLVDRVAHLPDEAFPGAEAGPRRDSVVRRLKDALDVAEACALPRLRGL